MAKRKGRRPRDIHNRRIPKPGTIARRIYDLMDSTAGPTEIARYIGKGSKYVSQQLHVIENPSKDNKRQRPFQKKYRLKKPRPEKRCPACGFLLNPKK